MKLKNYKNYKGIKNYKKDIFLKGGLIILSEKALKVLKPILEKKGQFVEVETDSKRKKFFGFYQMSP